MLSNQCELQYCRSSQHKKLVLYFPFSHCRHNGLFKGETYTYFRKVTTAFLSIRKQPCLRFKMFVCLTWVLHCILYMYSPVYMRVPVVVTFRTPAFHMVAQTARHQGPKTIWINNHDSYEKCTHQKSLWSWFQPTTDSDIILTISVLTHWKRC